MEKEGDFIVKDSVQSWILDFEEYLRTPFEQGGSGRYFSIPIANKDNFWTLFDEFQTRWPRGIELRSKGYFHAQDNQMLTCKIRAISIVDKWAPYSIKYPQF